jgi:hypothetical protein
MARTHVAVLSRVGDPAPHLASLFGKPDPEVKRRILIRVHIRVQMQELYELKLEPKRAVNAHNGDMEAQDVLWRLCRPVVADSLRDPDPQPCS